MDREGGSAGDGSCYYSVLGIRRDASFSDVRTAYRKLALKWHPDRYARNLAVAADAKRRFQQIQEAYSVLSDQSKRSMYDAGLYDPLEEEDEVRTITTFSSDFHRFYIETTSLDYPTVALCRQNSVSVQDFCDFMQEMITMMNNVKSEGDSLEDLQRMFVEMVGGDQMGFEDPTAKKRARGSCTTPKGHASKRNNSRS